MNIGFLVKRHRQALKITQTEMAEQFGVTQQTIAKWERGEEITKPREDQLYEWLKIDPPSHQENKIATAQVSLERLYHLRCGCCDAWWSIADRKPRIGGIIHCPDCGTRNQVNTIENE